MTLGEGQAEWTFLHGRTPQKRVRIVKVDNKMCQSVLILPLFWNVPTLPLTGVTMREVKRKSEYSTSHFVKFSLIETTRLM
jgi:hypothetical protein